MNTDQLKTNLDEVKNKAAETWDQAKDKVQFANEQVTDRSKELYYGKKADLNKNVQDVKDQLRK
jgi:hypothetical protein